MIMGMINLWNFFYAKQTGMTLISITFLVLPGLIHKRIGSLWKRQKRVWEVLTWKSTHQKNYKLDYETCIYKWI